ncbi:spore germination protein [Paenibacillus oenotherae]|uniref:Spore germination protein n=1 Tax=Paenibacillus oenotherae TaxID=1435645 RepID=A0ABS7D0L1_9BACL|nr:GerAB/ArcD/ProY family transporter [Paenibacillus oenotherae]MBW7473392.1 spore germination protein [Paenibacillus oenotherae]
MDKLSKYQIVVMIIMFELGSTPLFQLGVKAKQDSWLAMTLAACAGLLLLWIYLRIQNRFPEMGLADLLRVHFGKLLGTFTGVLFGIYFTYEASRNARDFSELTVMTILQQTPQWVIIFTAALISLYGVYKGPAVFFRVVEMLFPVVIVSYGIIVFLLFVARLPNFHKLLPMLENGIGPVAHAAFPDILSFPFGQMIVFLMFWHRLAPGKNLGRTAAMGYMIVAILLILMNALSMAVLGPDISALSSLPLLEVVQLIQIANILERLDVFVTVLLYIGLYVKMTLFYMAAVMMMKNLFKGSHVAWSTIVVLIICGLSFLEPNNTVRLWIGLTVMVKLYTLFQIAVPILVLVVGAARGLGTKGAPPNAEPVGEK